MVKIIAFTAKFLRGEVLQFLDKDEKKIDSPPVYDNHQDPMTCLTVCSEHLGSTVCCCCMAIVRLAPSQKSSQRRPTSLDLSVRSSLLTLRDLCQLTPPRLLPPPHPRFLRSRHPPPLLPPSISSLPLRALPKLHAMFTFPLPLYFISSVTLCFLFCFFPLSASARSTSAHQYTQPWRHAVIESRKLLSQPWRQLCRG